MTGFEKSVKGATKLKLAAPKSKYVETILVATHTGEAGVAEVFRTLQHRLRDSAWTIVFKALIIVHLMIREGQQDAALSYLSDNPKKIAPSNFSEAQSQGHNIRRYAEYLIARAKAFDATKTDYVRSGPGRLKRLSVDKGLLRETEFVQKQIRALLRCDMLTDEPENEISLTAFRLLTLDLLTLYSVMNEGTINVLEHYFEMSRPDSERALAIYKTFTRQTEEVVQFLGVARHFQSATRLEIPKLKHASTDLARLLEDDLNDPDFDLRRREYLAQKGVKKEGRAPPALAAPSARSDPKPTSSLPTQPVQQKPPPSDLIDFFESIEQNQQPMGQQVPAQYQQTGFQQQQQQAFYPQQTGFPQQQPQMTGFGQTYPYSGALPQQNTGNPFGQPQAQPLQPTPTGAGFGGYTPQPQSYGYQTQLAPIPQNGVASFPQQQPMPNQPQQEQQQTPTNPFRQSMMFNTPTGNAAPPAAPLARQNTNPFAKRLSTAPQSNYGAPEQIPQVPQIPPMPQTQPSPQPLQPQRTGTNPFARSSSVPPQNMQPAAAPLRPNPTGSTNPFRQSQFINQQTGQGWQSSGQHGTMGGLEQLETVPIFPRPGMT
ncbi:uncharacterized protein N7459_008809 [Penicillium hispanicum]|uniref:uncharacterized protein n=1 Tax=Penicillium hispanicum TaxID=1080232 RepID=UPI00253FAD1C|nr:uncharacterized protein N7459_008809 [Penicillium hispanicum]KAJ5574382.1 hypothetical protein N7459_008809 [Penicillium hispanicum]